MIILKREPYTKEQLLDRGKCCKLKCKNCPWFFGREHMGIWNDEHIRKNTVITEKRLKNIHDLLISVSDVPGILLEAGVYKGGSALLAHRVFPDVDLYLYDTFEGLPDLTEGDAGAGHKKGDFSSPEEHVRELIPKANIFKGYFPETLDSLPDLIRYAHLDMDLYDPTLRGLKKLWPNMSEGGVIVLDDYKWKATPGVAKAVDEWLPDGVKLELGPEFQVYVRKTKDG